MEFPKGMQQNNICTVREAAATDLDLILELGIQTFNETFAHLNSAEDMEAYMTSAFGREQIASELGDPLSTFLIAEGAEQALGYAKLHRGEPPAVVTGERPIELARLYVVKEAYGAGAGKALMQSMLSLARGEGFTTMWLGVWEHNERAKAFYRKWEFRAIGSHIFQLGSDAQTDLLMERAL
jgi:ribosomal protein S18 acetylase RimI-like enzyme